MISSHAIESCASSKEQQQTIDTAHRSASAAIRYVLFQSSPARVNWFRQKRDGFWRAARRQASAFRFARRELKHVFLWMFEFKRIPTHYSVLLLSGARQECLDTETDATPHRGTDLVVTHIGHKFELLVDDSARVRKSSVVYAANELIKNATKLVELGKCKACWKSWIL